MASKFGMVNHLCTGFVVTANWAISLGMMVPMSYNHNKFCLQLCLSPANDHSGFYCIFSLMVMFLGSQN